MLERWTPRPDQELAIREVLMAHRSIDYDAFAEYLGRKVITTAGCWFWVGKVGKKGYARGSFNAVGDHAHRLVYRMLVGEIPKGWHLDHLCRNRSCVNPDHLEPVTARENLRRGYGFVGMKMRQTHCKRGHALSGDNMYLYRGKRNCKTCDVLKEARQALNTRPCPTCAQPYSSKQWSTHVKRAHRKVAA